MALRAVAAAVLLTLAWPAAAHADRAFAPRFSVNTQGDIAIAANSIESCLDAVPVCASVRNGTATQNNNNDNPMTWLDDDGDPATFDSSSSTLSLPSGATVLFAGLYYGGKLAKSAGGSDAPNPAARNTVKLKAPGDEGYRTLTATAPLDSASTQYQGFVNITGIVDAAGPGEYTVADVQVGTGKSDATSGGWALVVAYGDADAASRNLSVFDGLQHVSSGTGTVTIPLSGFETPLSGPVVSTVGLVAYEGDLTTTGDGAQIQGAAGFTALANAVNPGSNTVASQNNVFNSTISAAGALVTTRTPSFRNNLGYDADLFTTTNVLGNGQKSTQVRLSTSGDAYQPGVVTLATDLYAPKITATKTVDQATANLGDILTYTVDVENTGQDDADATTFSDAAPAGTTYVPGSLTVNGAAVTDANGDDVGDLAGDRVTARLGTGATAAAGGTLAPNASATVSFKVAVATAGRASGATVENTADLAFRAATTGVASTVTTAPATTRINVPDLAVGKTHAPTLSLGQPSTYTITVGNVGDGPTSGAVTVTDTLVSALSLNGPVTGAGWACSSAGATITCTRSDPLAAGSDYPPISVPVLVAPNAQPGQLSNTATLSAPSDGNPDNNSFDDAGAVSEPAIDLHVDKVVTSTPVITPAGYATGETVTYRITVTNNGIADATDVQLTDTIDPALTIQSIVPSQGTCVDTTCNLQTIASGQAPVTVDVEAMLPDDAANYPSAAQLNNVATVSAPVGEEINPDDNTASAEISTLALTDVSLTKSFAPAQPVAGGPVTYTLHVHNDGPSTVDALAADRLPLQLQNPAVSITGPTGICQYDPTAATLGAPSPGFPIAACAIPQFEPHTDRDITITGTLAPDSAGAQVENFAFAATTIPFTDLLWDADNFADNADTVTFTPGTVDVGITKTRVRSGSVPVGGQVVFRLVARNDGDAPGTGVTVRDSMPAGLTPVTAGPGCTITGQDVVCRIAALGPGEQHAFQVAARAEKSAAGRTLTNRGTVTAVAADPRAANDVGQAQVQIRPLPPPVVVTTQCKSRRHFTIRLKERRGREIRWARVFVRGHPVAVMRRRSDHRLVADIDLRGLPKGVYHVVIKARLRDGRRARWVRSYHTCVGPLPPSNHLDDPRAL